MNMAFGITSEDIQSAAAAVGLGLSERSAETLMGKIDHDLVADAALHYDDIDEQTQSAHDEIRRQLVDLGVLPAPTPRVPAPR